MCGQIFRLPDDEAGGLIQCPQCNRLNDIPTLTELQQIAKDGTYKIEDAHQHDSQAAVADMGYVYQKGVYDRDGNEIDLRMTPAEAAEIGIGEPIPLAPGKPPRIGAPRYDPETGELITPLEIKTEGYNAPPQPVDPATIPMAKAVVNYATGEAARKRGYVQIFIHLLAPFNLAVIIGVFAMHVLLWPMLLVVLEGIMFLVVGMPFVAGAILAHYGNVIEDAGPFERDELPRPLRDLGWYEDLWAPFCNVFGSLILCYGPAIILPNVLNLLPAMQPFAWICAAICGGLGTFLFPAVLLTLQTSGTILNLRPDRVLAVIAACGRDYFLTLVIWVMAGGLYALGWGGTTLWIANMIHDLPLPRWIMSFSFDAPALAAGIFMAHYFCMIEGMLYRVHYHAFPWVLQRHIPTHKPADAVGLPPSRRRPPMVRPPDAIRTHRRQ